MGLTPQQEKALRIMETVFNIAESVSKINAGGIKDADLLGKRIFPKRTIPPVLKRRRKEEAKRLIHNRSVLSAAALALGVSQTATELSSPIPNYNSGHSSLAEGWVQN